MHAYDLEIFLLHQPLPLTNTKLDHTPETDISTLKRSQVLAQIWLPLELKCARVNYIATLTTKRTTQYRIT